MLSYVFRKSLVLFFLPIQVFALEYYVEIPSKTQGVMQLLLNFQVNSKEDVRTSIVTEHVVHRDNQQFVFAQCLTSLNFSDLLKIQVKLFKSEELIGEREMVSSLSWAKAQDAEEVVKNCEPAQIPVQIPLQIQKGLSQSWTIANNNSKKINFNLHLKSQTSFNWLGQIKMEKENKKVKLTGLKEPHFGYVSSSEFQYSITEVDGASTSYLEHGVGSVMKCERSSSLISLCNPGDDQCLARCLPVKNSLGCYTCDWE